MRAFGAYFGTYGSPPYHVLPLGCCIMKMLTSMSAWAHDSRSIAFAHVRAGAAPLCCLACFSFYGVICLVAAGRAALFLSDRAIHLVHSATPSLKN